MAWNLRIMQKYVAALTREERSDYQDAGDSLSGAAPSPSQQPIGKRGSVARGETRWVFFHTQLTIFRIRLRIRFDLHAEIESSNRANVMKHEDDELKRSIIKIFLRHGSLISWVRFITTGVIVMTRRNEESWNSIIISPAKNKC